MANSETIAWSDLQENWVKKYTLKNRVSNVTAKIIAGVSRRSASYFKGYRRCQKPFNFFDFKANSKTIVYSLSSKAANFKFRVLNVFQIFIKLHDLGDARPLRGFRFRLNIGIPIRENRF